MDTAAGKGSVLEKTRWASRKPNLYILQDPGILTAMLQCSSFGVIYFLVWLDSFSAGAAAFAAYIAGGCRDCPGLI